MTYDFQVTRCTYKITCNSLHHIYPRVAVVTGWLSGTARLFHIFGSNGKTNRDFREPTSKIEIFLPDDRYDS